MDARTFFPAKQFKQFVFFCMIGAGRITGRRSYALVFFFYQLFLVEFFVANITPIFFTGFCMQQLSKCLSEAISECLQNYFVVIIKIFFECFYMFLNAVDGYTKCAEIIAGSGRLTPEGG